jgi:hypothetical protein
MEITMYYAHIRALSFAVEYLMQNPHIGTVGLSEVKKMLDTAAPAALEDYLESCPESEHHQILKALQTKEDVFSEILQAEGMSKCVRTMLNKMSGLVKDLDDKLNQKSPALQTPEI